MAVMEALAMDCTRELMGEGWGISPAEPVQGEESVKSVGST